MRKTTRSLRRLNIGCRERRRWWRWCSTDVTAVTSVEQQLIAAMTSTEQQLRDSNDSQLTSGACQLAVSGLQILNRQTFKALPACENINLTSLLGGFYAASTLNI